MTVTGKGCWATTTTVIPRSRPRRRRETLGSLRGAPPRPVCPLHPVPPGIARWLLPGDFPGQKGMARCPSIRREHRPQYQSGPGRQPRRTNCLTRRSRPRACLNRRSPCQRFRRRRSCPLRPPGRLVRHGSRPPVVVKHRTPRDPGVSRGSMFFGVALMLSAGHLAAGPASGSRFPATAASYSRRSSSPGSDRPDQHHGLRSVQSAGRVPRPGSASGTGPG